MATTAAITVALRAKSSEFRKGMEEGRAALKSFREDARRTAEYARSLQAGNGGLIGSFKTLRTAAGAIGLEVVGRSLANVTGQINEMSEALRKGEANWADMTASVLESLPIIGGFAKAGANIGEMLVPEGERMDVVRERVALLEKERKAALDLSNAKKKERDAKAKEAADAAKAKFEAGENITAGLREQLVGLMGEGDALEFKLNAVGANAQQREVAKLLQEQIKMWEERNRKVEEAKSMTEGLADAARRATMTDREYTLEKLRGLDATREQMAIAWRSLQIDNNASKLREMESNRPEMSIDSASSVGALQKGSVEAVQAERRNNQNSTRMTSFLERMAKFDETRNTLLAEQKRLMAELVRLSGGGTV